MKRRDGSRVSFVDVRLLEKKKSLETKPILKNLY